MVNSKRFQDVTCIVPLPLHPEKEKLRGYNQAAMIADGLAAQLGVPVRTDIVSRARHTETQTRKHRQERWLNVSGGFAINADLANTREHALLIDDVVTTGASLEACGQALLQIPHWQLSIATITFAQR